MLTQKQNSVKKAFGVLLMVAMLCILVMTLASCGGVSVGDPNENPMFWPDGFVEHEGDTYHVTNGKLAKGMKVIEKRVYHFDEETGVMSSNAEVDGYTFGEEGYMVANEQFFELDGDRYYIVDNYTVENLYVIDGEVYDFGEDGKLVENEFHNEFVEVGEDTYYAKHNRVVKNVQIIKGRAYDFGEDGKLTDRVFHEEFVEADGATYYTVNNYIVKHIQIIDEKAYDFGITGKLNNREINEEFVEVEGKTYYIVNNYIVKNVYIIGEKAYDFGEDGVLVNAPINEEFVTVGGKTYYIVNNIIVKNVYIIDGKAYDFGEDGVLTDRSFDKEFVEVEGKTYYIVNNYIVKNIYIIEDKAYDFGEDGAMVDRTFNEEFVEFEGKTYYIVNNIIIKNIYIIDGKAYDFGEDGAKADRVFDKEFVEVGGNTYYVVNNEIVKDVYIIDGKVYDFGADGVKVDREFNQEFVVVGGDTYYVVDNYIVKNVYIIDGKAYDFGEDGVKVDREFDKEFVEVGGNTYYIVNNYIVKDIYIIDGKVYDFGADGVKVDREFDREYVVFEGKTYYIVNNYYVTNLYIIEDQICDFGEDGAKVDCNYHNEFVEVGGNTYYVVNNYITKNYFIIDGVVYDFGSNGVWVDRVIHEEFVTVGENTYYVENNRVVTGYRIIQYQIYHFDPETGIMTKNATVDGIHFGADGFAIGDGIEVEIDGVKYPLNGNYVREVYDYSGKVIVSDTDLDNSNNTLLSGAVITLSNADHIHEITTDAQGKFHFTDVTAGEYRVSVVKSGYITVSFTLVLDDDKDQVLVIDREVSNNLQGKVTRADTDNNATNNVALSGATVVIERISSTNVLTYTTTTDSSGYYYFYNLTEGTYRMTITKDGYLPLEQIVTVHYNQTTVYNMMLEMINQPSSGVTTGNASGKVIDSRTGYGIVGLTLYVRAGVGNTTGEVLYTLTTGAGGAYSLTGLPAGNYTVQVVDNRTGITNEDEIYGNGSFAIKILPGSTISGQDGGVINSVNMAVDSLRIVVTWGSTPRDLDSHLLIGNRYHIMYNNKAPSGAGANLDLDDTSSYGPETITVTSVNESTKYHYYIKNWTYNSTSELQNSGATVKIYVGAELLYTLYVPTGYGRYWDVFTYDTVNGFVIINKIVSDEPTN